MSKKFVSTVIAVLLMASLADAQQTKPYTPTIEPCDCPVKVDSSFTTQCGYLIVPENRLKNSLKTIKLPFIVVHSKDPNKRQDPLLYTAGGPGGSSLRWVTGVTKHSLISNRDCIAFEQRGTNFALPNLWSTELSEAIKESYRKNLSKDSMVIEGVKRYKKSLEAKGIDLSGYNTDETVADIHDLLKVLHIDSVNLFGGSYSGGLMQAVLQKDPSKIRSLVLDCPLPTFVPIDEDEPANFNEALNILLERCERDSANAALYGHIKETFRQYFTSIGGKSFYISYVEKGSTNTLQVQYTRNELISVVLDAMFDRGRLKDIPYIITELAKGNHGPYIKPLLDGIFNGNPGPSGMRISVYCADQTVYHDEAILHQLYEAYPYMEGFHINDVYRPMCDCWKVPPIRKQTKQPFYSNTPALLGGGALDAACRPLYIDMIHHYMPNSQRVVYLNGTHMVFGNQDGEKLIKMFLDNPNQKVTTENKEIVVY